MRATLRELRSAKVFGPLADLLHTGATLRELLHDTPAKSTEKGCRAVSCVGVYKRPNMWHITYRAYGKEKGSDPRGHLVKMRFLPDPEADPLDFDVEVSCDCYAFVYWGAQFNVKQRTALEREIPGRDGEIDLSAPTEARHNYVVCKHIAAVIERSGTLLSRHTQKLKEDAEKAKETTTPPEATPPTSTPPNPSTPENQGA